MSWTQFFSDCQWEVIHMSLMMLIPLKVPPGLFVRPLVHLQIYFDYRRWFLKILLDLMHFDPLFVVCNSTQKHLLATPLFWNSMYLPQSFCSLDWIPRFTLDVPIVPPASRAHYFSQRLILLYLTPDCFRTLAASLMPNPPLLMPLHQCGHRPAQLLRSLQLGMKSYICGLGSKPIH